jgi:hypothetical protein
MAHGMASATRKGLSVAAVAAILAIAFAAGHISADESNRSDDYFAIQVVDRQTGRGVPLVELRTTNFIRHVTDSHGVVAFLEPGLMDREVFFFVESHGYEVPKDGFGYRGVRLRTAPGTTAVVQVDRINIAERLYRVTGQGIYRDSILTGRAVPLKEPVLNGQVTGQDSVDTSIYHGRLFWLWGDTNRPSYPLGHFATAGAISDLPGHGGLDPAAGVNLEYFVDEDGFSRPLCPLKESGLVWLESLLTVRDNEGRERLVARFSRLKDLGNPLERGMAVFHDATQRFEPVIRMAADLMPFPDLGHAFRVDVDGRPYFYFATLGHPTPRMRVDAKWDSVIDPNRYEVLTALSSNTAQKETHPRWVRFAAIAGQDAVARAKVVAALQREDVGCRFYDVQSGMEVKSHAKSVHFNPYRGQWIMVFVQIGGESSMLGEVWYAEADTPIGPWAYARKVATHNHYSLYNPMLHPYFDQDGGRTIYFEGTYTQTFSGSEETATPRYDYNQIMYRLDLGDPRLVLPVPVYQVREGRGYLLGPAVAENDLWSDVESVAFYAVEPGRGDKNLIAIHAEKLPDGGTRLTTEPVEPSAGPLFLAMPPVEPPIANPCVVPLYEHRHSSGRLVYSTQTRLDGSGWTRGEKPLCRVCRTPSGPMLVDGQARPVR